MFERVLPPDFGVEPWRIECARERVEHSLEDSACLSAMVSALSLLLDNKSAEGGEYETILLPWRQKVQEDAAFRFHCLRYREILTAVKSGRWQVVDALNLLKFMAERHFMLWFELDNLFAEFGMFAQVLNKEGNDGAGKRR